MTLTPTRMTERVLTYGRNRGHVHDQATEHVANGVSARLVSRRVSSRDWMWRDLSFVQAVGPIDGIDAASVRDVLRRIAVSNPLHPLVCRLDRRAKSWKAVRQGNLEVYLSRVVTACELPVSRVRRTRRGASVRGDRRRHPDSSLGRKRLCADAHLPRRR